MAHDTIEGWLVATPTREPRAAALDLARLYRWNAFTNDVLRPAIWLVGAVIVGVAGTIGFAAASGWLG